MLLSYIGQTNDLKVQEQGTGGLAELQDSWNDGRIQFAFVRVKEAGSGLTKFVLIAWVSGRSYIVSKYMNNWNYL